MHPYDEYIRFLLNDPHNYDGHIEIQRNDIFYMFEVLQYPSNLGISRKNQWLLNIIKERIECILELKEEKEEFNLWVKSFIC